MTVTPAADERVRDVSFNDDSVILYLADGRSVSAPLARYPRLLHASHEQRAKWVISAAGYGIHWPGLDEDLTVEGLLRGQPAPSRSENFRAS
jgi:hypothetical protein